MSDTPPIGHNLPPLPTFAEMLEPGTVRTLIDTELDREPISPDGVVVPSIRARDRQMVDMCQRFLAAFKTIETDDAEAKATDVLNTAGKFPARVESARKALKQPTWDAGVAIDKAFSVYGTQLEVRPLTGPVKDRRKPPYTLTEQITVLLAAYKDAKDAKIRAAAQAEAERKNKEAEALEAAKDYAGAAEVAQVAEAQEAIATAPTNVLTRTKGDFVGSSSRKLVRVFEITAPHLVPRQYCRPSDALIRAAIGQADTPMPEIPGITIRDETDINRR